MLRQANLQGAVDELDSLKIRGNRGRGKEGGGLNNLKINGFGGGGGGGTIKRFIDNRKLEGREERG